MENYHEILLALILVTALSFLSTLFFKRNSSQKKLPPGPKPWPIIGNMTSLLGSSPHKALHSLSQKYGEIMLIKLGKFPVVVASSPQMAEQFLKVHDVNFATRPSLAAGKYTAYNNSNMAWSPYGPYWRQARKIYFSEVFCAERLEFFEPIRVDEGRSFLSRLHSLSGKPVVLRKHLLHYTLSNISRMVLSNKYFSKARDDGKNSSTFKLEEIQDMLDEWFLLNGVFNIGDWIPWLAFLDLQGYVKRMKNFAKEFDRFLEFVIDVHQARRDSEREDFVPRDVVDMLLLQAESPNLEVKLTRDTVRQSFVTGFASWWHRHSASTIEWAILEVLRHPRIAEKVRKELNKVIGRNRWVEENDMPQLPYINAIVKESWRMYPLCSLIAPHVAIEDCRVAGYDIAKGTSVIVNTWSLGRDPNSWDSPDEFLLERFLGEGNVDANGNHFALLPFGSGRRRCPGYKLGTKIVETTLANMLHGFEMRLADGVRPRDVSMEELYGLTTHLKESVKLIMEPTLPPS